MVNEQEHATNDPVQPQKSFFRRYRAIIIVVLLFAVVVFLVLRHHKHQQAQAALEGGGPGGGGRGSAAALGGGAAGGARGQGAGGGGPNSAVAVTVASVASGDIEVRIPALGTITPLATVTVRPQVSGILTKLGFQEGQLVKAGQFLAEIDPRPYQAALAQAKGTLRKDQALLADAKLDLKRFEELIKEDSVAQQQLDTQRALVDQYGGQIESDTAAVRTAQINLDYAHIVSPVAGRIGLRQVDQGNYVTPGDTNGLVVVTELQPISAIFAIPEDNVTALMEQLQVGNALTAEAFDKPNSVRLGVGQVKAVDSQIDTTTGTIKLRALFGNEDGKLFPNQFVNIQLVVNTLHDQLVMPSAAEHKGAPNGVVSSFVYLVNTADNTVSVRPVTLGVVDGERVAVTKGLEAGDLVVTEGGDRLRDGATVILPAATPKHPTTAAPGQPHERAGNGKWNGQRRNRGQQPPQGAPPSQ